LGRAIEDWRNFRIVVPEITLSKVLRLYLPDLTIEIEHVGGMHSSDSVVVRLPEVGVVFTGDCYYPPQRSRYGDGGLDTELIESLVDERFDTYINSYGTPLSRASFAQLTKQSHNGQVP
jgi:glyoxylase-like metal-dependent hydrolase (beta-lactamase superfamily II)